MKPQRIEATCGTCLQGIPGWAIVTTEAQANTWLLKQLAKHQCPVPVVSNTNLKGA